MDDDFELEVTDLRTGNSQPRRAPFAHELIGMWRDDDAPPDAPATRLSDEPPEVAPLGTDVAWKWMRVRALRGVAVAGVVALVMLALLASLPDSRAAFASLLHLPTPTATAPLPAYADQFSAVNGVPWGILRSDGERVALFQAGNRFEFSLPRGHHTIEYRADPFPTMSCVVSVPQDARDTCRVLLIQNAFDDIGVGRYLDFGCTPQALSIQQRVALEGLVQNALDTFALTTEVPAGARYLGTDGDLHVAPVALAATFSYRLNFDPRSASIAEQQDCMTLCNSFGPEDASIWFVEIHAVIGWRFSGVGVAPFAVPAVANQPPDVLILAQVTWRNGWRMGDQPFLKGDMCNDIVNSLTPPGSWSQGMVTTQAAPNPADGCLYSLLATVDSASTAPAQSSVYLYRYGLLLAVNAQAHAASPQLPSANGDEQALARHLATQPPG